MRFWRRERRGEDHDTPRDSEGDARPGREITRRHDLPAWMQERLRNLGLDETQVLVAVPTDVGDRGTFEEKWVLATEDRLLTMSPEGTSPSVHLDTPLNQFKEFIIDPQVGSALLEGITREGRVVTILRYSNALRRQMPEVARHLQSLAQGDGERFTPNPRAQDDLCPTCGATLLFGSRVCPRCLRKGKTLRRLAKHIMRYRGYVLAVWGIMLLATGMDLLPPYVTKMLIDQVLPSGVQHAGLLGRLVLLLAIARLAGVLLRVAQSRLMSIAATSLTYDVRSELYAALQKQSLGFYDQRKVGNLMSRVTNDTNLLQSFLVDGAQNVAVNVLILLGIGVMLFVIDPILALYVLLPAPLVVIITKVVWTRIRTASYRVSLRWADLSGVLNDSLSGIRVVKAFGQERQEIGRFDRKSAALFLAGVDASQLAQTVFPLLAFLVSSGSLWTWWMGGLHVMHHQISLGTLLAFLSYLGMFYGPLQSLTNISSWLSQALTASERVFEVMDARPEVSESKRPKRLHALQGRFEFRDVGFGYDPNAPVLKGLSLTVEAGEMIGLVGRSGVGKTTLINLICRFYDVSEGAILLDGTDLREIALDDYRRCLGVVLQEPFLFSGSLLSNIVYPRMTAPLDEAIQAAKAANAHEFIMRGQDGYDMQVGDRGHRLSGGERQRISIARALLHNPKILILDEATASVDTQTEQDIQEAMSRLTKGRTVFAIAHRLSTLSHADRLVVIDEGRIAEMGSHGELLRRKGLYHRLVQMQNEINRIRAVAG